MFEQFHGGWSPLCRESLIFFRSFFLIEGTELYVDGQQMERVLHLGQSISSKNASLRKMHPATWAEQHQTTPSFPAADFLQTIPGTAVREAGVWCYLAPPWNPLECHGKMGRKLVGGASVGSPLWRQAWGLVAVVCKITAGLALLSQIEVACK